MTLGVRQDNGIGQPAQLSSLKNKTKTKNQCLVINNLKANTCTQILLYCGGNGEDNSVQTYFLLTYVPT